jgi:hypothetical protein
MEGTSISVALCTYNGARFLPEQLESIAAQLRLPDELVVCDDRSADDSVEIVKAFALHAPFAVRLEINESNLGSTKNFEKAIGLCQGEIIALTDQDDVWKPQKLTVLRATLEDHPEAGYAFSDAQLIGKHGTPLRTSLWESVGFRGPVLGNFSTNRQVGALLHRATATGATMAFRSRLKSILLPISSCFVQDYWISLLASCLGSYGKPVPEPLIQYRQHAGQQIGALRKSILQKVRWARQLGPTEYSRGTQGFLDVRERLLLAATQGWAYPANHLTLVEEKIRHCSQRASAHSTRGTAKISKVLSEVMTGRYARFSNSWRSVVEDLCF